MPVRLLTLVALLIACVASVEADSCSAEGDAFLQMGREARRHVSVEEEPRFKVLVLGAPRTGTQSMYAALTRLGFHPLHTGIQWVARVPWCNYFFGNGSFEQAMTTMSGFDSAMDEPFHLMYEDVMKRYPDCKFVLTASDPEIWYASVLKFMLGHRIPNYTGLAQNVANACQHLHYFGCNFADEQTPELKERCLAGYIDHYERVKRLVPPKKLLIFNLSDGYRPLAEFLGKPVPDEPFPYQDQFQATPFPNGLQPTQPVQDQSVQSVPDQPVPHQPVQPVPDQLVQQVPDQPVPATPAGQWANTRWE